VSRWKLAAELDAVADGVHRAMPRWEAGVPHCREDGCVHYDGKRCELLGVRPGDICEPAVAGMAAMLDRRITRGLCPCCTHREPADPDSIALAKRPDQEPR
jgi:hypothetical protein